MSILRRFLIAILTSPRLMTAAWLATMIFVVLGPCWPMLRQAPARPSADIAYLV